MGGEKFKYFAYSGIAVFVFAIAYFIVSIYTTMVNGESRSQYEFSTFVQQSDVSSYASIQNEDDANAFFQKLQVAVDQNSFIVAIVLNVMEKPVFAYPMSSNVIQLNTENQPILNGYSPMLKTYSMSLPTQNGQHVVLNAISYVLRPQDIFNSARVSFLIVLAYTLALIVVIVFIYLSKPTTTKKVVYSDTPVKESASHFTEETHETIPVVFREQESSWDDFFPEVAIEDESAVIIDSQDSADANSIDKTGEGDYSFEESFVEEYIKDEKTYPKNENEDVGFDAEIGADMANDEVPESNFTDPMGLFSDITGVGWESYLETRLDSELIRSASSEQDLALIFIQVKGIEKNANTKKKLANLLIEYFKYRDFVFEYKDDGFAGILLDIDLDQTMILTEQLYGQMERLLLNENLATKIGIGVSTRSLRILPGSRIITEASEAVNRAFDEDGLPIVAFRVSPDKYRQYVSNSSV